MLPRSESDAGERPKVSPHLRDPIEDRPLLEDRCDAIARSRNSLTMSPCLIMAHGGRGRAVLTEEEDDNDAPTPNDDASSSPRDVISLLKAHSRAATDETVNRQSQEASFTEFYALSRPLARDSEGEVAVNFEQLCRVVAH